MKEFLTMYISVLCFMRPYYIKLTTYMKLSMRETERKKNYNLGPDTVLGPYVCYDMYSLQNSMKQISVLENTEG